MTDEDYNPVFYPTSDEEEDNDKENSPLIKKKEGGQLQSLTKKLMFLLLRAMSTYNK